MVMKVPTNGEVERSIRLSLDDLLVDKTGLLWAINRYLLHPRGYALAVQKDDGPDYLKMLGDGSEPWSFSDEVDERAFVAFETAFPVRLVKRD